MKANNVKSPSIKYYTIYKITHTPSGKFYVGRHITHDLNDGYMGSGKYLKAAIEKHGIDEFIKEYLFIFYDPYFMYLHEEAIVTEELCRRIDTYNIQPGGFGGGFEYINSTGKNLYGYNGVGNCGTQNFLHGKYRIDRMKQKGSYDNYVKKLSEKIKEYQSVNGNPFLGKSHTEEVKKRIGKTNSKLQSGSKNSQYGTMWITDGNISKKVSKHDRVPEGWTKGRN